MILWHRKIELSSSKLSKVSSVKGTILLDGHLMILTAIHIYLVDILGCKMAHTVAVSNPHINQRRNSAHT